MADKQDVLRIDKTKLEIGDRILSEGHFATVRYIGQVPPTKGIWLGVEWDDTERGKHDGSHEGHRYFHTKSQKSGSFIRCKKAELGVPVLSAVEDRYGRVEDDNAGVVAEDLFVLSASKKQTVVEMVGAKSVNEKQSKLDQLQEVVLRGMLVYGAGLTANLTQIVPSIQDLDLSQNLLPSWQAVSKITKQLPKLRSLNVSENKLEIPDNPGSLASCFASLKVLFLNRTGYTWEQVLQCSPMFPELEQLHVCFNCIQTLSNVNGSLQKLTLLNLESNQLSNWSQILKVGNLPLLETMIVSDNGIESISFDDVPPTGTTSYLYKLKSLTMNYNKIEEWRSINELNKLKTLQELRIKSNPILGTANPETVRQLFIAKLQHLKVCNRTEVTLEERKGAEIDYLKRFGPEWVKCGGHQDTSQSRPSAEFMSSHPRYQQLVEAWGPPEDSEMKKQSTTLKSSLISISISCPQLPDKGCITKKLPATMSVQKLKAMVQRLFKIDEEMKLTYVSTKMKGPEIELDNDLRPLSFYSIDPGDTIHINW